MTIGFVATKIFASNLNPKNAQRFYNLILMPAVRDDIRSNRRLNYHLYRSLKKALYKPAAFFKGILLPLCARGEGGQPSYIYNPLHSAPDTMDHTASKLGTTEWIALVCNDLCIVSGKVSGIFGFILRVIVGFNNYLK